MHVLERGLLTFLPPERVKCRLIDRYAYASDASHYYLVPKAVVQPISIEEVVQLFQFSHTHQLSLTFRAGGTSLSGQGVTDGILVDLSNYWRKVIPENNGHTVRVEPAVIGAHVNLALKKFGRKIGPLETDKTITAWIPLQATPLEMGPLEFSAGSHHIVEGRELEIGDESEQQIQQRLRVTDFPHVIEPFEAGEISFHSGWIFHRAGANKTNEMRKVMTIIYMDREMRLKKPENDNQLNDWNTWCPGALVGEVIDTSLNPLLT